jgi:hypothetical protein
MLSASISEKAVDGGTVPASGKGMTWKEADVIAEALNDQGLSFRGSILTRKGSRPYWLVENHIFIDVALVRLMENGELNRSPDRNHTHPIPPGGS